MKTLSLAYPTRGVNAMPLLAMLFYALLITPVMIDVRADAGDELSVLLRVRLWRFVFRVSARICRGRDGFYLAIREGADLPETQGTRMKPAVRMLFEHARARRYLLSRVRIHALNCSMRIGTGDAAYTAWLAGALTALFFPLSRRIHSVHGTRPHFDVRCDWGKAVFILNLRGIITLLPGDIMAALVLAAAQKLRKEAKKRWTGIPLKA